MQLLIFKYESENHFDELTTVEIDGEIWFAAPDVCALIDIKNVSDAVSSLDDDEKLVSEIPRAGQMRKVNLVNESGLYALIFKSKKDSAKAFRKWVTKEVLPSIRKSGSYGINRVETPNFIIRYNLNWERVERVYFSVINELYVRLYAKFEHLGYKIPNRAFDGKEMRPDNSVGILFSRYLQMNHPSLCANYKMYDHWFPNISTTFPCKQYKNEMLHIFTKFVDEIWIPEHAENYFRSRDELALKYLPKLLRAS